MAVYPGQVHTHRLTGGNILWQFDIDDRSEWLRNEEENETNTTLFREVRNSDPGEGRP